MATALNQFKLLIIAPIKWFNAEADYIIRLSRGLLKRGHKITILGLNNSPLIHRAKEAGIKTEDSFRLTSLNPFLLRAQSKRLKNYFEQERFNIIDIHRSEGALISAYIASSLKPKPLIVRTRQDMRPARMNYFNHFLHQRIFDHIITSNELIAFDIQAKFNIPQEKIKTIYLGINPEECKPKRSEEEIRKEFGISPDSRLVALSGRIGTVKGHNYLLKSAPEILKEIPEARFLISYPMIEKESRFLPELEKSGLKDKFYLFGPLKNQYDLLSLAEVAVISSVGSEAQSRTALEWMALKKPIVATRVGVLPELIINAETGYLIMPRDSDSLSKCTVKLLKEPALAKRMGEKGYNRLLENFQEEKMVLDTEKLFLELIEKTKKSSLTISATPPQAEP